MFLPARIQCCTPVRRWCHICRRTERRLVRLEMNDFFDKYYLSRTFLFVDCFVLGSILYNIETLDIQGINLKSLAKNIQSYRYYLYDIEYHRRYRRLSDIAPEQNMYKSMNNQFNELQLKTPKHSIPNPKQKLMG